MRPIRAIALVVVAWILGAAAPAAEAQAPFVKTVGRWSAVRTQYLLSWRQGAGLNDVDAVTGPTRLNHTQPLTITWNLQDRQGAVVPDGQYKVRMELAEANSQTPAQNNQGTFTFTKGPAPQNQTNLANGGFTNVSLNFNPATPSLTITVTTTPVPAPNNVFSPNNVVAVWIERVTACNNGVIDGTEKCDPAIADGMPGACPATCAAADACMPVALQGDRMQCTAECVAGAPITACVDGDGCCADGCSEAEDSDCGAGGGGGAPGTTGGCETGAGGGFGGALAFGALGLTLLIRRRRR
ncbi:MAG TPA: MYXO-CTERM sorting domain-containing protein [Kofleriaceae bacterium]|nr:MYXO-CTERM sorting domain-containing protein [Kofleriaceae bacterium]